MEPSPLSPPLNNYNTMYTLIYNNGEFNRPSTLRSFLQANVVMSPQIQIDCITPYNGTAVQLMDEVCAYLCKVDQQIVVLPNVILNSSTESTASGPIVSYLVVQINVRSKI